MPTRNVVITEHQSRMIDELVASGRYQNASEVLREGLRLIEARAARESAKLQALREAVQVGLDDIEAGRSTLLATDKELDDFFEAIIEDALNLELKSAS